MRIGTPGSTLPATQILADSRYEYKPPAWLCTLNRPLHKKGSACTKSRRQPYPMAGLNLKCSGWRLCTKILRPEPKVRPLTQKSRPGRLPPAQRPESEVAFSDRAATLSSPGLWTPPQYRVIATRDIRDFHRKNTRKKFARTTEISSFTSSYSQPTSCIVEADHVF